MKILLSAHVVLSLWGCGKWLDEWIHATLSVVPAWNRVNNLGQMFSGWLHNNIMMLYVTCHAKRVLSWNFGKIDLLPSGYTLSISLFSECSKYLITSKVVLLRLFLSLTTISVQDPEMWKWSSKTQTCREVMQLAKTTPPSTVNTNIGRISDKCLKKKHNYLKIY